MRPQKDDIGHLDWTLTCGSLIAEGIPCMAPARWFVEFHRVGQCTHAALNDCGNSERYVCDIHLQAYEAAAERVVRKYQPSPRWIQWFRPDPHQQECPTCAKPVLHPGDVLQCIVQLPEGNTA